VTFHPLALLNDQPFQLPPLLPRPRSNGWRSCKWFIWQRSDWPISEKVSETIVSFGDEFRW
jgi:hypothetical protein